MSQPAVAAWEGDAVEPIWEQSGIQQFGAALFSGACLGGLYGGVMAAWQQAPAADGGFLLVCLCVRRNGRGGGY